MKKSLIISILILIGLCSSFKSFAQSDLFINNTTNCSYTVDIYWSDGSNCQSSLSVNINAFTNFTVTNPIIGMTATAEYVVVYDNTCLNTPIIGACFSLCNTCSYVSNYIDNNCTYCGSQLHFQFIPRIVGTSNAQLYIHN